MACFMVAAAGSFLSALVFFVDGLQRPPMFFCLWAMYLSLFQVGRVFMQFQWDILLLETGFLFIFHSSNLCRDLSLWALRLLLFKLMFLSGVVKLQSGCSTWLGLTALNFHYATQCLPTPMAWWAHQAPAMMHRLSVAATLIIELPLTIWILSPFESVRLCACALQVFLQVLILITGNYNFFNLLTILLCVHLADPGPFFKSTKKESVIQYIERTMKSNTSVIIVLLYSGISTYYCLAFMFEIVVEGNEFPIKLIMNHFEDHLKLSIQFIKMYVGISTIWYCLLSIIPSAKNLLVTFCEGISFKFVKQLASTSLTLVFCVILCVWCMLCYVPFASLVKFPCSENLVSLYQIASKFGCVSSYGLFRRMTGVEAGIVSRPEVVFELHFKDVGWKEIDFRYKPGDVARSPDWIAPHQPRLDWQMWFAALGDYNTSPWTIHLAHKLVQQKPSLLRLMGLEPDDGVDIVRAFIYKYDFTNGSSTDWWKRDFKRLYIPEITKGDQSVVKFLNYHGWEVEPKESSIGVYAAYINQLSPRWLLLGLPFTKLALKLF